ncbi:MAG: tyrosine-type recombinase/integrase [Citrobacter freundii]|uniref:tyrosine-type recombinase/integrase n=1 Tax=Citrobacter freundii TaxID=546 RepID=UPI0029085CDD|nr:tyrosine-type recombinase/integrase [Citrobacter freundii]HED2269041.1 tyrosine-type recombinase/integrase [Citrobacter freundii]
MKLTARTIDTAKPKEKPYKLSDGAGLFLLVNPNGSKYWRVKYYHAGKERLLAVGVYPEVSLKEARERCLEARRLLRDGIDPVQHKHERKAAQATQEASTFQYIADEYIEHRARQWTERYTNDIRSIMRRDVFPVIGNKQISEIQPAEVLALLRTVEDRGAIIQARKVRQRIGEVFNYATATGRAERNPAGPLSAALQKPEHGHNPFIPVAEVPAFLDALESYTGSILVKYAIKLLMITGLRTVELRRATWSEIDFDDCLWNIPAEHMKKRRPHIVPLSSQAVAILCDVQELTGYGEIIFPGRSDMSKPINAGTLNNAIKLMGYGGRLTPHGLRHLLSTVLHDAGYPSILIELTLAHADQNTIRGTYNHAQLLPQRREMLQSYADWLDSIRTGQAEPLQVHQPEPIRFPTFDQPEP